MAFRKSWSDFLLCWGILLSNSSHKCSMGFKSGLCGGHFRRLIPFLMKNCWAFLDVCFGSLSCWKIKSFPRPKERAESPRLFSRMSVSISAFILEPMNAIWPTPEVCMQPHTITQSDCFTVGIVNSFSSPSPLLLQQVTLLLDQFFSNFDLSDQIIFWENSSGLSMFSLANSNRLFWFFGVIKGLLLAIAPIKSPSLNLLLTVDKLPPKPRFSLISFAVIIFPKIPSLTIALSWRTPVDRFLPRPDSV